MKVVKKKPKISTIKIRLKDGVVDSVVNDTGVQMFVMSQDGVFIMSNYPLTIQCARCKGTGKDGYFGTRNCGVCSGTGRADLYQIKDKC